MKLIEKTTEGLTFQVSRREKVLLVGVLQLYPILPDDYHHQPKAGDDAKLKEAGELLNEALLGETSENKARVLNFIQDHQRFEETEAGILLRLKTDEVEWVLQVLNEIRVGSWRSLGSPSGEIDAETMIKKAPSIWAMELTGRFQHLLLVALDQPDKA